MSDSQFTPGDEVFKPIPDFPGYEVSNQGRVRSFWRRVGQGKGQGFKFVMVSHPQKILKPELNQGYLRVRLSKEGRKYKMKVHRLVLLVFKGPCPPGMEACHEDGKPANCLLENLRWDTKSANSLDSVRHGTQQGLNNKGIAHPMAKLTEQQVIQIKGLAAQGNHSQRKLAQMFGVCQQTISLIVNGQLWPYLP